MPSKSSNLGNMWSLFLSKQKLHNTYVCNSVDSTANFKKEEKK